MRITSVGDVKIPFDSKKLYFGAGDDYSQYFDGTNQKIDMLGGNIVLNNGVYALELYDTVDQTTNYEKFRIGFDTANSVLNLHALHNGTASANNMSIGISATATGVANRILNIKSAMPMFSYNIAGTGLNGAVMLVGEPTLGDNTFRLLSSTGVQSALKIAPQIDQSGTASYKGLEINIDEDTVGSGTNYLIDAGVNSSSKFSVNTNGNVIADGNMYALDFITLSKVADFNKTNTIETYFKDVLKWKKTDGTINYLMHPAGTTFTKDKVTGYITRQEDEVTCVDLTEEVCVYETKTEYVKVKDKENYEKKDSNVLVCSEQPVMECEQKEVCEYVLKEKPLEEPKLDENGFEIISEPVETKDEYTKVCSMIKTDCKQKQECTTKKVSIQEPVIETVTHNGLSMETRVAELEKMVYELNEKIKILENQK
jgi:hypothetical protein